MSGRYLGDGPPNALQSMERIYGFLAASPNSQLVMAEWQKAREGLATVADYHQVVSELASLACQLAEPALMKDAPGARRRLMELVEKLQAVSPET